MNLSHRHFKKEFAIPRLVSRIENDMGLVMLATPWGDESATSLAFEVIIDYLKSSQDDIEATTPFEKMEILNKTENDLRAAVLLANEKIFREINRGEYVSALELTLILKSKYQMTWLTTGGHQLQIRSGDFAALVCGSLPHPSSPLPSQLMGVDRHCWMQCGSCNSNSQLEFIVNSDGSVQASPTNSFPASPRPVSFWSAKLTP